MKVSALNYGALALALAISAAWASSAVHSDATDDGPGPLSAAARESQRIVSASSVADQVLAEIARPSDVVAISSAARGAATWRFQDAARIARVSDVEDIVELRPTVVFASAIGGDRSVQRLREAGIRVVSLGELRGFDSLAEEIERVGEAIGAEERAALYARELTARMDGLRRQGVVARGMYLSVHGTHFYGGTQGSSYADILRGGGVDDIAAAAGYRGWPELTMEELLRLDPPLLVMPEGDSAALCRQSAAEALAACRNERFVELPGDLLNDPGPGLVTAAAALRDALGDSP